MIADNFLDWVGRQIDKLGGFDTSENSEKKPKEKISNGMGNRKDNTPSWFYDDRDVPWWAP